MKVGFSGSREGMTDEQRLKVADLIYRMNPVEVHHGDCLGADAELDRIAGQVTEHQAVIISHPCDIPSWRAMRPAHEVRKPKRPLERNHDIVNESDHLIATPKGPEGLRSGTWATIRWAKKQGKPITIIYPDGSVEEINGKQS